MIVIKRSVDVIPGLIEFTFTPSLKPLYKPLSKPILRRSKMRNSVMSDLWEVMRNPSLFSPLPRHLTAQLKIRKLMRRRPRRRLRRPRRRRVSLNLGRSRASDAAVHRYPRLASEPPRSAQGLARFGCGQPGNEPEALGNHHGADATPERLAAVPGRPGLLGGVRGRNRPSRRRRCAELAPPTPSTPTPPAGCRRRTQGTRTYTHT